MLAACVVIIDDEAPVIDVSESVIGLLLVLLLLLILVGLVTGRRVTEVDLTVDVLVIVAGLCDDTGFEVVSFLSSPADTTENVVVNASSS